MIRYIYDNENILLELDGSNNIVARYTHGPGIDEPLILERGGASFSYHADGLGSITEITDATGAVRQRYTYSSFGKIESRLDPNFVQPYTFTSREFDPETSFFHYRKRVLDQNIGRFLQQDSIGIVPFGPRKLNHLYAYVDNNPINFVDPLGLLVTCVYVGTQAVCYRTDDNGNLIAGPLFVGGPLFLDPHCGRILCIFPRDSDFDRLFPQQVTIGGEGGARFLICPLPRPEEISIIPGR